MKNDKVIRIDDTIKILDPTKFIHRVGYPLIWTDFYEEIQDDLKMKEIAKSIGCDTGKAWSAFCKAAAMGKVQQLDFGGNDRKIIYSNDVLNSFDRIESGSYADTYYKNKVFVVTSKKIARTGVRFAPHGWYDDWSGEYNHENGGLSDQKTHILIQIEYHKWIESIHVEKVKQ